MLPKSTLLVSNDNERHCAVPGCGQPPCFQTRVAISDNSVCGCADRTADACAGHLVDVISDLGQWARRHCPNPVDVTVYAADHSSTGAIDPAPVHGFAFTTIRVPG